MPRKTPGYHDIHVLLEEDLWPKFQYWAESGIVKITAKEVISTLLHQFIKTHIDRNLPPEQIEESIITTVAQSIQIIQRERQGMTRHG